MDSASILLRLENTDATEHTMKHATQALAPLAYAALLAPFLALAAYAWAALAPFLAQ